MIFDKGKYRQVLLLLTALSAPVAGSADQWPDYWRSALNFNQYAPIITLSLGPDFVNQGNAQTLTLSTFGKNRYTLNDPYQGVADAGISAGVEIPLMQTLSIQLGVSGYVNKQLNLKGEARQLSLPEINYFGYVYHIHPKRLMFTNKILTTICPFTAIHPYFSWEVGAAYNRASGYQEWPRNAKAIERLPFGNHDKRSFAWGVGVGFDYDINQYSRIGAGYQFANLGSASLGAMPDEASGQTLWTPNLYTNQLRMQLTFLV